MKNNKAIFIGVLFVAFALVGVAVFSYIAVRNRAINSGGIVTDGKFPAADKDARVYAVVEKYLQAQAKNDRQTVLTYLSSEHRDEWTDNSFLITNEAVKLFDEIKLVNVRLGVIDFITADGEENSALRTMYQVQFLNGGTVMTEAEITEDLGLVRSGENWLINISVRTLPSQAS